MNFFRRDHDDEHTAQTSFLPDEAPLNIRRPWSPPSHRPDMELGDDGGAIARYLAEVETQPVDAQPRHAGGWHGRRRQREPSEISVDALDLADYSHTMDSRRDQIMPKPQSHQLPTPSHTPPLSARSVKYPPISLPPAEDTYSRYPVPSNQRTVINLNDTAPFERPFSAQSLQSRTSGRSAGAYSLAQSSNPRATPSPYPRYSPAPRSTPRHTSLPAPTPREPMIFSAAVSNYSHPSPKFGTGVFDQPGEVDVKSFPKWSRDWYDQGVPFQPSTGKRKGDSTFPGAGNASRETLRQEEADLGIWPPQAAPNFPSTSTYPYASHPHSAPNSPRRDPMSPSSPKPVPWGQSSSALGHGFDTSDGAPQYVPDSIKEERMRMLEREFGPNAKGKGKERAWGTSDAPVGAVDEQGSLVTDGPKRRAAVRWMQTLLAAVSGGAGLYGALAIHPNPPASPAGKPASYIMYGLAVATCLMTVYMFHLRPCIGRRKRRKRDPFTGGPGGMMVLPIVQGLGGGKGKKKWKGGPMGPGGKKGQKGKGGPGEGVQVNLIVDPAMFGGGDGSRRGDRDDDDNDDEDERSQGERPRQRKSIFAAVALEQDWRSARATVKWSIAIDVFMALIWFAEFFFVLWSARCTPGTFGGWCDTYNVATACGFLTGTAFCFAIYYDIRDLSLSKQSPRTKV